ncbi:MAG: response regulator [Spirochaetes bacterium]|nr:response regulator [Spirochaetota bacterium]MBN2770342.1 response regulator [Spirochaetota bacterium]
MEKNHSTDFMDLERSFMSLVKRIESATEKLLLMKRSAPENLDEWIEELGLIKQHFSSEILRQKAFCSTLFESEMKYRELFESSIDYLFLVQAGNMQILDINKSAKKRFGDVTDFKELFEFEGENFGSSVKRYFDQVVEEGETCVKASYHRNDSTKVYVSLRMQRLDLQGKIVILVSVRDLSEELDTEARLIQSQKLETLGMLAGGIAHDFNNILSGITGTVSLMKYQLDNGDKISDDDLYQYVEVMQGSSDRAREIIQQLLAFSKNNSIGKGQVEVNQALDTVAHVCKNTFDKSININFNRFDRDIYIAGDPAKLDQILLNICINASHAMTIMRANDEPYGGVLELECGVKIEKKKEFAVIRISDTGIGMDDDTKKQLFDPFFTTKDSDSGTGLGLSMVYAMTTKMNGSVSVDSSPGNGAVFTLKFPVLKNVKASNSVQHHNRATLKGTVLLVDDEDMLRATTSRMLKNFGLSVIEACNGQECIDIFIQNNRDIDLVLLDIMMPGIGGDEVFMVINKINPKVPVIMVSGFVQKDRFERINKKNIAGFISKPFTLDELYSSIGGVLNHRDGSISS